VSDRASLPPGRVCILGLDESSSSYALAGEGEICVWRAFLRMRSLVCACIFCLWKAITLCVFEGIMCVLLCGFDEVLSVECVDLLFFLVSCGLVLWKVVSKTDS